VNSYLLGRGGGEVLGGGEEDEEEDDEFGPGIRIRRGPTAAAKPQRPAGGARARKGKGKQQPHGGAPPAAPAANTHAHAAAAQPGKRTPGNKQAAAEQGPAAAQPKARQVRRDADALLGSEPAAVREAATPTGFARAATTRL
jgi:hypothetical protein